MKKHFFIIGLIHICILTFCVACDKLPENGKLDGNWQVLEVQYARDGQYDSIVSVKEDKIFWAVQLKLIEIKGVYNGVCGNTLCRFVYADNHLTITEMYYEIRGADSLITDTNFDKLVKTGIMGSRAQFQIEALDGNRMQLKSDFARIIFRKF